MQEQKLERITPAQAGLDPQCIINMMDRMEKEHINITSFMLLRHGKVLCEASYEPYDAAQLRTVYSLSKTFTSMELQLEKERLTLMKRSQIYLQRKLKTERFR